VAHENGFFLLMGICMEKCEDCSEFRDILNTIFSEYLYNLQMLGYIQVSDPKGMHEFTAQFVEQQFHLYFLENDDEEESK
jgi:hypothetical protein